MPESMWRLILESAIFSAFKEYLKLTFSKSILPLGTVMTGSSGLRKSLVSSNTSAIRFAEAEDRVSITNIIESIIRLINICIEYVIILVKEPMFKYVPWVDTMSFEAKYEIRIKEQ